VAVSTTRKEFWLMGQQSEIAIKMNTYQITFETWNKVASLYQDKFMELTLYNDTYDRFCQLIEKQKPSIFEIGCGPGNITRYLLKKRPDFQIQAVDISPNMIELAKTNNPTAQFSIMDCRNIDTMPSKFDAIICGFCMPYLSKNDTEKFFKDCARLLTTGGILYFSTIKGDYQNSGFELASTGDKTYVYYYDEPFLRQQLSENHFTLLDLQYKDFQKANQETSIDMIFIARKA
jgi:ubiquinone/menaquinone biosynthesis C-methylase UbiE